MAKSDIEIQSVKPATKGLLSIEPDPVVLIKGYGALKNRLVLPPDIDWTKPVYAQVMARISKSDQAESSAA